MDRKWKTGAAGAPPALDNASDGYATAGNPGGGVPATKPGPHWYHMVTEELLSIIAKAGVAFDKAVVTQVRDALELLYDTQGIDAGGRLTLTTGVPVTTADVAGAATVFYTPYRPRIRLYDGTRWKWYTFAELSQALNDATKSPAAAVANTNYDKFVWDDAGALRCTRGPTWNAGAGAGSDTARGTGANSTELEFFEGRWVNKIAITNGPAARRGLYVGTIRTDGAVQANDTLAKRHVWNAYNGVLRPMLALESADTWTYSTATLRQSNANAANQVDFVLGLPGVGVLAKVFGAAANNTQGIEVQVAIGLDSTAAMVAGCLNGFGSTPVVTVNIALCAEWRGYPGLGRHFLAALEYAQATGVTTWRGDGGTPARTQSGISAGVIA